MLKEKLAVKIILILAAFAVVAFVSASQADTCRTTCNQYGDQTYCRTTCY